MDPELRKTISKNDQVRRGLHLVAAGLEEIMGSAPDHTGADGRFDQYDAYEVIQNFEGVANMLGVDMTDRGVMEYTDPDTGEILHLTDTEYDEMVQYLRRHIVDGMRMKNPLLSNLWHIENHRLTFLRKNPGEKARDWPMI